jgi:CxxC-x17-CxxC domain-containing protein
LNGLELRSRSGLSEVTNLRHLELQTVDPLVSLTDYLRSTDWMDSMEFKNRILTCVDCADTFIFSADEQLFFNEKHFINDPKHCKKCKAKRAAKNLRGCRETQILCAECGTQSTVPFRPVQSRPVLCRACFQQAASVTAVTA